MEYSRVHFPQKLMLLINFPKVISSILWNYSRTNHFQPNISVNLQLQLALYRILKTELPFKEKVSSNCHSPRTISSNKVHRME